MKEFTFILLFLVLSLQILSHGKADEGRKQIISAIHDSGCNVNKRLGDEG